MDRKEDDREYLDSGPAENPFPQNDPAEYSSFSEKTIRHNFVRKVYCILVAQLCVTLAFISAFLFIPDLQLMSQNNPWLWGVAFVATIVCLVALACCPNVRRSFPSNFIFLGVFTVCESFLLGTAAGCYETYEVLMTVGVTAVVVFGLTLFAMQTKWDFTMLNGTLFVLLIVLICFGLLCAFIRNYYLRMLYAAIGTLVFSLYLVFDTQLMMGGNHKYAISPEEYVFAALNLYLDIVNLFLMILQLFGGRK